MNEFTLPTEEQIWGEVFQKIGTKCAITDFAILLGGYVGNNTYLSSTNRLDERTCCWWSVYLLL